MVLSEESHLIASAIVLDHSLRPWLSCFSRLCQSRSYETCHINLSFLLFLFTFCHEIFNLAYLATCEILHLKLILVKRMRRKIHSHKLLFHVEFLKDVLFSDHCRNLRPLRLHFLNLSKQGYCTFHAVLLEEFSISQKSLHEAVEVSCRKYKLFAGYAEAVECTGVEE